MQDLNLRLPICKNGTLPAELIWQRIAGDGLEPTTSGVWTLRAIQLLYPAVPDARIELTASWSQTRRSTKLSQSGICSRHAAAILQGTNLQEKRMLSSYAATYRSSDPTGIWTRKSPDRQSGGITNYPMRPLYILACASSIYPQIYTRTLFAIKRKPNGQGEIRTHNVSSVTVLQTACFSHFAYLP